MNTADPVTQRAAAAAAEAAPAPVREAAAAPGRSCPLDYRYQPADLARMPLQACDTLYVVGGLYGNPEALAQVLALFAQEPAARKRLVFNGDFNWFNADDALFAEINTAVLQHQALRGNVETELARGVDQARETAADDAGCGCAYPAWVGDGVVARSNRILQRLRGVAQRHPALLRQLAALPMWARLQVGPLRVAVVHGDAHSLAGWDFAREHLLQPAHRRSLGPCFEAAEVDAFACSHTCLPVFCAVPRAAPAGAGPGWVLNNGAAGMPNFSGDPAGLLTRIALKPFNGPAGHPAARRHGIVQQGVHIDALAVDSAPPAWRSRFARLWPEGSDAHASYAERIAQGPAGSRPQDAVLALD